MQKVKEFLQQNSFIISFPCTINYRRFLSVRKFLEKDTFCKKKSKRWADVVLELEENEKREEQHV